MWKECSVCSNYEISKYGDVRNKQTGKILKQKLKKDNYLEVSISMGSRQNVKHCLVHRLVAEAFIPNPESKPQVNHKDGNTTNNQVTNLEWVTNQENITHSIITGLKPNDRGENSCNSKMTKEQVQWCRDVYKPRDKEFGCRALAKMFNVSKSTMSYILTNKTYL